MGKKRIWGEYTGVVWLGLVVEGVHHLSFFSERVAAWGRQERGGVQRWVVVDLFDVNISIIGRHPFLRGGSLFSELDFFAWVALTRAGLFLFWFWSLGCFALGQLRGSYSFTFLFLPPTLYIPWVERGMGWSIHRDLAWSDLLVYVVYGMVSDVLMMIAKT